jgi:hypothetical protein
MTLPSQLLVAIILHPTVTHSERTFTIKRVSTHTQVYRHEMLCLNNLAFSSTGQRENCWIFQSEKLHAVYLATLPARLSDSTDSRWLLAAGTLCIKYLLAGLALFSLLPLGCQVDLKSHLPLCLPFSPPDTAGSWAELSFLPSVFL